MKIPKNVSVIEGLKSRDGEVRGFLLGRVAVDSGCVLVADPCYLLDEIPEFEDYHSTSLAAGPGAYAVMVRTFTGDGIYPAYLLRDGYDRPRGLFVDFNPPGRDDQ